MKKLTFWFCAAVLSVSLGADYVFAEGTSAKDSVLNQNTMSVLWYQKSGEAKALYYQGYNFGKHRLDEILSDGQKKREGKKPAIVLDIDETVLDNSPYHAWMVQTGKGDPLDWSEWFNRAEAKPLPGALEFLQYADSKGIAIFYISNRREAQKAATIKNLKQVGAPQADTEHVLLQQDGEVGKEQRREHVAKTHEIVLLFGDNLNDFKGFDQLSAAERVNRVESDQNDYGNKLIVFPNPMYGDWEAAIYRYDLNKSAEEISKLRKESLEGIAP
jgi:5'-nucleotidase (lipoprotein e(P4) family)